MCVCVCVCVFTENQAKKKLIKQIKSIVTEEIAEQKVLHSCSTIKGKIENQKRLNSGENSPDEDVGVTVMS